MERKIQLRLFASLRSFSPADSDNFTVSHGETIESILKRLDIPQDEVSLIIIDGVRKDITSRLEGGERVGIFPLIGGGLSSIRRFEYYGIFKRFFTSFSCLPQ
ncbi:MAG: MoaD/ThiS family protein [Thermodesulfobacteriota bacterium]|nr:MoaD/ThiS family protein [Thermodesulfobacteriota bacterium]